MNSKLEILQNERERLKNCIKLTFTDVEVFVTNRKSEIKIFKLNKIINLFEDSNVNVEEQLKMIINSMQTELYNCEKNNNIEAIIYYDALLELVDLLLKTQKQ